MKAIFWDGDAVSLDSSYSLPISGQDTAIVKVHLAGICSTDLQIFKGYMKFRGVPGHEFVGSVGQGPKEWLDKRVVGESTSAAANANFASVI
jgi:threonine dehydrogenase-like Zn-dependent dehydrogenase